MASMRQFDAQGMTQPAPQGQGGAKRKQPQQGALAPVAMPPPPAQTAPFQPLPQAGGAQLAQPAQQPMYKSGPGGMAGAQLGVGPGQGPMAGPMGGPAAPPTGGLPPGIFGGGQGGPTAGPMGPAQGNIPPQILEILRQLKGGG